MSACWAPLSLPSAAGGQRGSSGSLSEVKSLKRVRCRPPSPSQVGSVPPGFHRYGPTGSLSEAGSSILTRDLLGACRRGPQRPAPTDALLVS